MIFLETPRFPLTISYASDGGPEYSSEVVTLYSGAEQRNGRWMEPLYRFNAATGIKSAADLYTLLQFFHAVGGKLHGFRFKDWSDYRSGAPNAAISRTDQTIIASATAGQATVQLAKTYVQGALTRVRNIKKPVANTLILNKNGSAFNSGWTLDTATGIITFSPVLSGGDAITGGFEFDVPCRFDTDRLSTRFETYQYGQAEIPIVGIRL